VRDITPETLLEWQRRLAKGGGVKTGKPLAPNTIRLARAPLAGAFKLAVSTGLLAVNPLGSTPRPTRKRAVPRHWSPEEARAFLGFMEADRTFPIWAFLMSAGLRIGELVVRAAAPVLRLRRAQPRPRAGGVRGAVTWCTW
jgi:integrase